MPVALSSQVIFRDEVRLNQTESPFVKDHR
jgi:hypothetical protein